MGGNSSVGKSKPSISHSVLGAEYLQEFLSTAFSRSGAASLPYTEDSKPVIRSHLSSLYSADRTRFPESAVFTYRDGRSVNLLKAESNILICHSGSAYFIGASIWLPESYPRHPPRVFLTPDPYRSVKANHPYVSQNRSIHVPYLDSWIFPSSNLVDLVESMSHLFSQDSPVCIRQPNPSPRLPPTAVVQKQQRPAPAENPSEVYKRNAINKILESVHGDMMVVWKAQEAEMEGLSGTKEELRKREQEILRGMRENEGKRRQQDLDVDDMFEPADAISKQMLECTAADLAVDDEVYSLDLAVQEGAIPFKMYLKSVRALSREQFFHRALAAKLRALQVQAQMASMAAARVPPPDNAS